MNREGRRRVKYCIFLGSCLIRWFRAKVRMLNRINIIPATDQHITIVL